MLRAGENLLLKKGKLGSFLILTLNVSLASGIFSHVNVLICHLSDNQYVKELTHLIAIVSVFASIRSTEALQKRPVALNVIVSMIAIALSLVSWSAVAGHSGDNSLLFVWAILSMFFVLSSAVSVYKSVQYHAGETLPVAKVRTVDADYDAMIREQMRKDGLL